ncbi:MAG: hypothetical protein QM581_11915 [Pseudomonas sp.]
MSRLIRLAEKSFTAYFLSLLITSFSYAQDASFDAAINAYADNKFDECASILETMEREGNAIPNNGELLRAECLSAGNHFDAALTYLKSEIPKGRISFDEVLHKDRPGLDKLRRAPGWPAFLKEAGELNKARVSRMDVPLRDELIRRAGVDQEARKRASAHGNTKEYLESLNPIDKDNTRWLKNVVQKQGWPTITQVGPEGASAAWVLIQHADEDPAFQAEVLPMMERLVMSHEADSNNYALLTDRVLISQGKPQRYGSQFHNNDDGSFSMSPTEDESNLDARRIKIGLQPIAEYKKMLSDAYGKPVR